jgi:hypothetical protein
MTMETGTGSQPDVKDLLREIWALEVRQEALLVLLGRVRAAMESEDPVAEIERALDEYDRDTEPLT